MEALGKLLENLLKIPGYRERLKAWGVLLDWEEVVGEELARRTWPVAFAHGRLTLGVADPIWGAALRFEAPKILEALNKASGEKLFTSIRFVIEKPPAFWKRKARRASPLSPEEEEKAQREAALIEDPELREAFRRWRRVLLQAQKRSGPPPKNKAPSVSGR